MKRKKNKKVLLVVLLIIGLILVGTGTSLSPLQRYKLGDLMPLDFGL